MESIDFTKLIDKYTEDNITDDDLRLLVRNVRRRLYDALNVMISAGIVHKGSKNHLRIQMLNGKGSGQVKKE